MGQPKAQLGGNLGLLPYFVIICNLNLSLWDWTRQQSDECEDICIFHKPTKKKETEEKTKVN